MEHWKAIDGYEGLYEVSDQGRVRSVKRGGRVLKGSKATHGYIMVSLCKNNQQKLYLVHRLVAQAFIPNHENKPQVNHIDGDKSRNLATNLEWVTPRENLDHARETGLIPEPDEPRKASVLIKLREEKGWTQRDLAKAADVGWQTIVDLERNEKLIRQRCVSTIHKIARALDVSIETLAGYDERG